MVEPAEKPSVRAPLEARPQAQMDRRKLRDVIADRFSKTFEYLSK
jgi:hypothetical protein